MKEYLQINASANLETIELFIKEYPALKTKLESFSKNNNQNKSTRGPIGSEIDETLEKLEKKLFLNSQSENPNPEKIIFWEYPAYEKFPKSINKVLRQGIAN